jgi:hypothetical protein
LAIATAARTVAKTGVLGQIAAVSEYGDKSPPAKLSL